MLSTVFHNLREEKMCVLEIESVCVRECLVVVLLFIQGNVKYIDS